MLQAELSVIFNKMDSYSRTLRLINRFRKGKFITQDTLRLSRDDFFKKKYIISSQLKNMQVHSHFNGLH